MKRIQVAREYKEGAESRYGVKGLLERMRQQMKEPGYRRLRLEVLEAKAVAIIQSSPFGTITPHA